MSDFASLPKKPKLFNWVDLERIAEKTFEDLPANEKEWARMCETLMLYGQTPEKMVRETGSFTDSNLYPDLSFSAEDIDLFLDMMTANLDGIAKASRAMSLQHQWTFLRKTSNIFRNLDRIRRDIEDASESFD